MSDSNEFGGKNPKGLYVPMSEDEQEVVARLIESDDLEVNIVGWHVAKQAKFVVGDSRVGIVFNFEPDRPEVPKPLWFLDLELRTRAGLVLFKQRQPTVVNGHAVEVCKGMVLTFAWDIQIHSMPPELVKAFKPGAIGLTSRRIDKDTGERTEQGNMILTPAQQRTLHRLTEGQEKVKEHDREVLQKAETAAKTGPKPD